MAEIPLILASGSAGRKALLASLGVKFTVMVPVVDEIEAADGTPVDCVRRLSRSKAQQIAGQLGEPGAILAADSVVCFSKVPGGNSVILGKPADEDHARRLLQGLRGRDHQICTGVTLLRSGSEPCQITTAVFTIVWMRDFGDEELDAYIATGKPFDKAGGYAIEDDTFAPVERIEGSYSNVVGLPLEVVREMLAAIGFCAVGGPTQSTAP